eukprot:Nitzschia sp. Nitz4//scaffold7_size249615//136298//137916//NITZ4_001182-RA/size249615-processed-gene-0.198-mRNA-1//-1//CDS//3329558457//3085//frame0
MTEDGVGISPKKPASSVHETLKTVAGVAGNVLEWYDFAVFGFFSDVLGQVFFPKEQSEDLSVAESFAVFGGAFLMRPIGGLIIGYIGDVSGRKKALEISIFLMAFATTAMGCLPTYDQIGGGAILLLVMVRMLQGLSVGGQLMSSLIFTLEGHPQKRWGLYGSCVMAAGNFGTFLGGVVAFGLRAQLSEKQLLRWGWRLPFLSGTLIAICGIYLRYFCKDDEILPGHAPVPTSDEEPSPSKPTQLDDDHPDNADMPSTPQPPNNPLRLAFAPSNRKSLLASTLVPMLWSGGFYLSFVWMVIYMQDLTNPPVPHAFAINSGSLLLLGVWFPVAGLLSDWLGRLGLMTIGAVCYGIFGPVAVFLIGQTEDSSTWIAPFVIQTILGLFLALFGAPMCAWLVEAFEPEARLTSVSIGYNLAQAVAGGISPFLATIMTGDNGSSSPGFLLSALAVVSLLGLRVVNPPSHQAQPIPQPTEEEEMELPDIS